MAHEFTPGQPAQDSTERNSNANRLTLADAGRREASQPTEKTPPYMARRIIAAAALALVATPIGLKIHDAYSSRPAAAKDGATEEPIVVQEPGYSPGDKLVVSNHAYYVTGKNVRTSPRVIAREGADGKESLDVTNHRRLTYKDLGV